MWSYLDLVVTGVTLDEVKQRLQTEQRCGGTTCLQNNASLRNEHATLAAIQVYVSQTVFDFYLFILPQNVSIDGIVTCHADDFAANYLEHAHPFFPAYKENFIIYIASAIASRLDTPC